MVTDTVDGPGKAADYLFLTVALVAAAALLAARVLRRVEVVGDSMLDALSAGDRLLVVRGLPLSVGQVIVVADPRDSRRRMVKRVDGLTPAGVGVRGDNPDASTDSRHFGPVPRRQVLGRAVYRYHPPEHRGPVRSGL